MNYREGLSGGTSKAGHNQGAFRATNRAVVGQSGDHG